MASLWTDRLAEVWASPGKAGSGVVIGTRGVLTARHVVEGALESRSRLLARVVRPGRATAEWSPATLLWEDDEWDLALLVADDQPQSDAWETPPSGPRRVVFVNIGAAAVTGCEAVGFPDFAVQRASRDPDDVVRQTEHVLGTVLGSGQGKPPVNPRRKLPKRWLPFEITTTGASHATDWRGMSGAGVTLGDGRLVGIITTSEADLIQRRLYVVPLAEAIAACLGLTRALSQIEPLITSESLHAPQFGRVCVKRTLGEDGLPRRVAELELDAFGVEVADLPGEPKFLSYVPRDGDGRLLESLQRAAADRQMVLIIGDSASGKSRSAAEAVRRLFPEHRLVRPSPGQLHRILDLPLIDLGAVLVWLDDVTDYTYPAIRDSIEGLLDVGAVVVGTVRRTAFQKLFPVEDFRDPAGEALRDPSLVTHIDWALAWTKVEKAQLKGRVAHKPLLEAVAAGMAPGVYLVAGPLLTERLHGFGVDGAFPYRFALVHIVVYWYLTGVGVPLPLQQASSLIAASFGGGLPAPRKEELEDAVAEAVRPVIGVGRTTRQSLLYMNDEGSLSVHDYLLDIETKPGVSKVPSAVWDAALDLSLRDDDPEPKLWRIGSAAWDEHRSVTALSAMEHLARRGDPRAVRNVALVLDRQGRSDEAIAVLDSFIHAMPAHLKARDPLLAREVALAAVNRAAILARLGRTDDAIAAYDHALRTDNDSDEVRTAGIAATIEKGVVLAQQGRFREAEAAFDDALLRVGEPSDSDLRTLMADALLRKAQAVNDQGRPTEARDIYDRIPNRFAGTTDARLQGRMAEAEVESGTLLIQLGNCDEGIEWLERVIERIEASDEPAVCLQLARALNNRGAALGQLGRNVEAYESFEEVVTRFSGATSWRMKEQVVMALRNQRISLELLLAGDDSPDADESIEIVHSGQPGGLIDQVATAVRRKLAKGSQTADRVATARDASVAGAKRFTWEEIAQALLRTAVGLGRLGAYDDELAIYEQITERFGNSPELDAQVVVAKAIVNAAISLGGLEEFSQALALTERAIDAFSDAAEPLLRCQAARAYMLKAAALGELGREAEATAALNEVSDRFGDAPETEIAEIVAAARAELPYS